MSTRLGYLAVDQSGETIKLTNPTRGPRAQLLEELNATHASKMYVDTDSGESKHIGYIIRGQWFTIYEVHEWIQQNHKPTNQIGDAMSTRSGYLAVDQSGETIKLTNPTRGPRAQLLDELNATHASKMYVDTESGESKHIGYIIRGQWFTIYEVHEWTAK